MSYIDFIFCIGEYVISKQRVNVSIFDKCHYNIIYGKINIHVPLKPTRNIWHYSKASVERFKNVISTFNSNKPFENLSTDEKVELLNETLLNSFRNNIPNKKIKCDFSSRESDHDKVLEKSPECTTKTFETKKRYILEMINKLEDPNTASKTELDYIKLFTL